MEQIVVPQFLDVEDKIIGPITVRQFIEMMIGGLIIFIFFKIFDFSAFAVFGLLVLALTLILAFLRINGQPFHYFLLNFIATLKSPKLKVWKKEVERLTLSVVSKSVKSQSSVEPAPRKTVSASRLSELSLVVDTGGVYRGENN